MRLSEDKLRQIIREVILELNEARKKKVIRKGKLVKKTFCFPGQKAKGGRCVAMKSKERAARKIKAKKGAIKRKGKMARIKKKRAKAMRKRKTYGIK
jgi:hypothetical protein